MNDQNKNKKSIMGIIIVAIIIIAMYGVYTLINQKKDSGKVNSAINSSETFNDVSSNTSSIEKTSSENFVSSKEEIASSSEQPINSEEVKEPVQEVSSNNNSELLKLLEEGSYSNYKIWTNVNFFTTGKYAKDVSTIKVGKNYVTAFVFNDTEVVINTVIYDDTGDNQWEKYNCSYTFNSSTKMFNIDGIGKFVINQGYDYNVPVLSPVDGTIMESYMSPSIQLMPVGEINSNFIVETDFALEEIRD